MRSPHSSFPESASSGRISATNLEPRMTSHMRLTSAVKRSGSVFGALHFLSSQYAPSPAWRVMYSAMRQTFSKPDPSSFPISSFVLKADHVQLMKRYWRCGEGLLSTLHLPSWSTISCLGRRSRFFVDRMSGFWYFFGPTLISRGLIACLGHFQWYPTYSRYLSSKSSVSHGALAPGSASSSCSGNATIGRRQAALNQRISGPTAQFAI